MINNVVVDPSNYDGILALMDKADDYDMPLFGENEEGEKVMISINNDNVTVQTFQKNNWIRTNVYWRDYTTEELFSR